MSFADEIGSIDRAAHTHLGGEAVTYVPGVGSAVTVMGMFDEDYVLVDPERPGVEMTAPVVVLRLEDLPTHPDDDDPTIQILGIDYKVQQRLTDGNVGGSIRLLLHKVTV